MGCPKMSGILFGAGNGDCANYLEDGDNGWFVGRMTAAATTPIALPTVSIVDRRIRVTGPRGPAIPAWDRHGRDILGRRLSPEAYPWNPPLR